MATYIVSTILFLLFAAAAFSLYRGRNKRCCGGQCSGNCHCHGENLKKK